MYIIKNKLKIFGTFLPSTKKFFNWTGNKKIIGILVLGLILSVVLTGCSLGGGGSSEQAKPVTLEFWGVFDSSDAYRDVIAAYQTARPNIKINYKKLHWGEYERELLEAWAEDRGPDIFLVHNDWISKYQTKMTPMPAKLTVPVLITTGSSFSKKTTTEVKRITSPTPDQIKKYFVDVVYRDVVRDSQVWGLPLSVDTLALFYNQTILDAAGIVEVPETWEEMVEAVKKITRYDSEGNISRSAIAMGGANNILRSDDILTLLMIQNGTKMVDSKGSIAFGEKSIYDNKVYPGIRALEFYTDFAMPMKNVYTWNSEFPEATDAFLQGRLAMMFGFSYQLPYLKAQGPSLDLGIAPMVHINKDGTDAVVGQGVNLADYWVLSGSKKTENIDEVWDFITFSTMNSYKNKDGQTIYQAESYLDSTSKPPALRGLINKYREDPKIGPFASQALNAKSWYQGKTPEHVESVFNQTIRDVLTGSKTYKDAIEYAAKAIRSTY